MTRLASDHIKITNAGPADAKLLSVLASATFYEAYFEQDEPHNLADYIIDSFAVEDIAEQIEDRNSTFLIAFLAGKAVGYAKLVAGSREPCITAERTVELKRIYLVERVWRRGVGETLLNRCIQEARRMRMDSIWLGVWQMNSRAKPFYEKNGFVTIGTLEFPYGDAAGINDVMELKLR